MLEILIPENNSIERKYIIGTIFNEFLRIPYTIKCQKNQDNYIIYTETRKQIFIEDHFFNKYKIPLSYLNKENIPKSISYSINEYSPEPDIPIIYGRNYFEKKIDTILCGIDIFASCFFMITRWEESVIEERDKYGRISENSTLAWKNSFLSRPVVNEYVELLRNMLISSEIEINSHVDNFRLVSTHDVDRIYSKSIFQLSKSYLNTGGVQRFLTGLYYRIFFINPVNSFKYIMDMCEKNGVKANFYFMTGGTEKFELFYNIKDPYIKNIISIILDRGHTIGIHPSFYSSTNDITWKNEWGKLADNVDNVSDEGRQHFLCFSNPGTWRIWEANGMKFDSTMGLSKTFGFRCGTGNEYTLFDILDRKTFNLKERPLIVMDAAIRRGKKRKEDYKAILHCRDLCRKYHMPFTILFHNHLLDKTFWNKSREIFDILFQKEQ